MKNGVISDMHLYHNKMEYFIKLLIWWGCWLGGVWVLWGKSEGVASAFFVFALSQLMEFAPGFLKKNYFLSKLLHLIFCIFITVVLLISMALLFTKDYNEVCHVIMNVLSLMSLGYMSVDCVLLLLCNSTDESQGESSKPDISADDYRKKFEGSLQAGSLGNVGKGN